MQSHIAPLGAGPLEPEAASGAQGTGNRYLIEVTAEQLQGLKHALVRTQATLTQAIPERERGVAFFEAQSDSEPEKERYLAISRQNLADARANLTLVNAAVPAVYNAKLLPARKRRLKAVAS